jgi:hypothetical protein
VACRCAADPPRLGMEPDPDPTRRDRARGASPRPGTRPAPGRGLGLSARCVEQRRSPVAGRSRAPPLHRGVGTAARARASTDPATMLLTDHRGWVAVVKPTYEPTLEPPRRGRRRVPPARPLNAYDAEDWAGTGLDPAAVSRISPLKNCPTSRSSLRLRWPATPGPRGAAAAALQARTRAAPSNSSRTVRPRPNLRQYAHNPSGVLLSTLCTTSCGCRRISCRRAGIPA